MMGVALVDRFGDYLGKVKAIDGGCYVVDRSYARLPDLSVPFDLCVYGAKQLKLIISRAELGKRDCWAAQVRGETAYLDI